MYDGILNMLLTYVCASRPEIRVLVSTKHNITYCSTPVTGCGSHRHPQMPPSGGAGRGTS